MLLQEFLHILTGEQKNNSLSSKNEGWVKEDDRIVKSF